MMPIVSKYKLSLLLLIFICVLFFSFYWTRVPMVGFKTSAASSSMSFRFGYFSQQEGDIGDSIKPFRDISYFAASHQLLQSNPEAQAFQFYPIYDGSTTLQRFNQTYPHVPTETVPGYGKSVYAASHGNARMFFLNADR